MNAKAPTPMPEGTLRPPPPPAPPLPHLENLRNPDPKITKSDFDRLEEKLDHINRRLNLIFGDQVLISGSWTGLPKL